MGGGVEGEEERLEKRLMSVLCPSGTPYNRSSRLDLAAKLRAVAARIDAHLASENLEAADRNASTDRSLAEGVAEGRATRDGAGKPKESKARVTKKQRQGRAGRDFDFSRYAQRYVALEVVYIGWDHWGFASVADSDDTIEANLFRALEKTRLVPESAERSSLLYSRCGRTDRGVSALGQVVALLLRSAANAEMGASSLPPEQELDYPALLNKVLPPTVRVSAWAPIQPSFNARFSTLWREYKYFILPTEGTDLAAMQRAAAYFVGQHDFRNFCKIDAANVNNFIRSIAFFHVNAVEGCHWGGRQLYELHLRGSAFLWHQVRCMAAVLMLVGDGHEKPEVVKQYLDIRSEPRKPQYAMAPEDPLILYACGYESLVLRRSAFVTRANCKVMAAMLDKLLLRAGLLWTVLKSMKEHCPDSEEMRKSGHIKFEQRAKEPSVEEKLARYGKVPIQLEAQGAGETRRDDIEVDRESNDGDGSERAMAEMARLSH